MSIKITADYRYSMNFLEVYSLLPSFWNYFTCLVHFFSLMSFLSFDFSRASDFYLNMYSSVCLRASLLEGTIYWAPPLVVSRGPHMSECTSCKWSVELEVVFGVTGFQDNLNLIHISRWHFPVIGGVLVFISKFSTALRLLCAKWRCHNISCSASCQAACPVVVTASSQLLILLIWVYSVDNFEDHPELDPQQTARRLEAQ